MYKERGKSGTGPKKGITRKWQYRALAESGRAEHFINRHKSWLEFNSRVLHEATDERNPLVERIKFCNIFRSNNDEFFQKNVGPLFSLLKDKKQHKSENDDTPLDELLESISKKVRDQIKLLEQTFEKKIVPSLEKESVKLISWKGLSKGEKESLVDYFKKFIFPILTPLVVDSGHPFPFLFNLSKFIGISMTDPESGEKFFARVNIPHEIPQWITLRNDGTLINIEEIIRNNLHFLFNGMPIESHGIFRITRVISDDEKEDMKTDNIKSMVEEALRKRKSSPVVRLEYEKNSDYWIINFLQEELALDEVQLFEMLSLACYSPLNELATKINLPKLEYAPFSPSISQDFKNSIESGTSIFKVIGKKDCLLSFPYESFASGIENFLNTAASDPAVKAIKITLYRTDREGRLIKALIKAAENKKQVVCIIELKAPFDEEANLRWSNKLSQAGVYIIYGLSYRKIHAKIIAVARMEREGIRTYVNISTGNYNPITSNFYTDFSFFTCDQDIGQDVLDTFNFLTAKSALLNYKKILLGPSNLFQGITDLINREIRLHKKKGSGCIILKMNSLEDPEAVRHLYAASACGVQITLIIRGLCILRPGLPNISENIRIYSIVGRFLEHSRIMFFGNGEDHPDKGTYFIGSADWKRASLRSRVEVMVPVVATSLKSRLWNYLELCMNDNRLLWELRPDGSYVQRCPGKKEINSQEALIEHHRSKGKLQSVKIKMSSDEG